MKQIKEPLSTVLCSIVKHAGSVRKKCGGKHETQSSIFPHFLGALPLPKWFENSANAVGNYWTLYHKTN